MLPQLRCLLSPEGAALALNTVSRHLVLRLTCPDTTGIVAAVASAIASGGGSIEHADQHTDIGGTFFQRIEFTQPGEKSDAEILATFADLKTQFNMQVDLQDMNRIMRVGLLASKQPHCLFDMLIRWKSGELPIHIPVVISNHADHADFCRNLGVEFHHLPVTAETRQEQELNMIKILNGASIDLVVMARYMQILTPTMLNAFPMRVINIHHSFLPAFIGGNPYRQAFDRGVKLVGATAHYATEILDDGPILEQEVVRVSHRDTPETMARKGRDLETMVLARAVRDHVEHRVMVLGNRTVVFN